jgi:peroxiredoxin family protein
MIDLGSRNSVIPSVVTFELTERLPAKPFSIMSKEGMELLQKMMKKHPTATLQQLGDEMLRTHNVQVCTSSMSRARMRIRKQKLAA